MKARFTRHVRLAVDRGGVIGRRDFLRNLSAAGLAGTAMSWTDLVSLRADDLRRREMACILLWMQGGPSQFETLDPKPGHANGGGTKTIATSVPGTHLADNLPKLATMAGELAIIRSLTTKEGNHQRASFLLHTAHVPTASVHYPTMGSVVSAELGNLQAELPSFVRIGRRFPNTGNGGLLGTDYNPFAVPAPEKLPDNTQVFATNTERFARRLALVRTLETAGGASEAAPEIAEHRGLYQKASRMVLSPKMEAFDLTREPEPIREAYGKSDFAAGCLLARRLVEAGVTFVEVGLGNWDTHDDNFNRTKALAGELDQPFAQLIADLKARGRLEKTLVIWMGEFGRTPRVNPRGGRDHYPRAFSAALAGGTVRGGQVIGSTNAAGDDVQHRPVKVEDLFRTFYKSLGINSDKVNMSSIGRPIKIVEGGEPVSELFG
ncbi:MAG TPA: DUF1501 domain-containing protein [Pirellulales bacterium]|jgi:hypothetical protein|nr:DUF1501 domain-containing protein [Pirellulales bacterium]